MKNSIRHLLPLLFLFACSSPMVEVVEESYDDGSAKLVRYYKDETREVLLKETQYYENGNVYIEGTYKDGEREGTWTAWYKDGTIWSRGEYKAGKENGKKTVYHENGQVYYEGEVRDDERAGTWTFWNKDGELLKKVEYGNP